jgi:hypothetical protein
VARLARRLIAVVAALAALAALAGGARAQALVVLHVRAFQLSLDKTSVNVGEPFHLIVHGHVDEGIDSLDNVVLPNLAGLEDLGDERRCTHSKAGTDCVETLTIDANSPGDREIGPATLSAIDATTGKPRNFESNLVTVHVTGQPKVPEETPEPNPLTGLFWWAAQMIGVLLLVAIALWALIWGLTRSPRAAPPPVSVPLPAPPPPAIVPADEWETRMRELVAALEREPTRPRAVAVRAALRERVGARDEETLGDLVARNAANGRGATLAALSAVERAAFCEDARVVEAVREALPFLNR